MDDEWTQEMSDGCVRRALDQLGHAAANLSLAERKGPLLRGPPSIASPMQREIALKLAHDYSAAGLKIVTPREVIERARVYAEFLSGETPVRPGEAAPDQESR